MPSSSSISQQQFVVQAVVNSVTQCFQPCSDRSDGKSVNFKHTEPSPMPANSKAATKSENDARNQPTSSPPMKKQQYDADRYIHRKLEIFRTTDEDCIAAFGIPRPRPSSPAMRHARRSSSRSKDNNSSRTEGRDRKSNTLVSSSDEEISNLAKNQKRLEEEQRKSQKTEYAGTFVESLFRIMQDPLSCITNVDKHYNYSGGGLCFANPVRMAEPENVSNISDWRLTAKEFRKKYQDGKPDNPAKTTDDDLPDAVASNASEEATMTSASYFDQKYAHIIEKNPPLPLFHEYLVDVSENNTNGVMKILERRRGAGVGGRGDGGEITPTRAGLGGEGHNNSESPQSSKSSRTPIHIKVKKNSRFKACNSSQAKPTTYDSVPIGKSSSVSTQSADDEETSSPSTSTPSIWQRMCNNSILDKRPHQPDPRTKYREAEFVYSQDTLLSH
jgi:hypothetical protein